MYMRRNWRPTIDAIGDHHYRIVDANLSVHDFSRSVFGAARLRRRR